MLKPRLANRYDSVTVAKASGSTYTPSILAEFVARELVALVDLQPSGPPLVVFDPAVGEGELLASLLRQLPRSREVEVHGFDQDKRALQVARKRLAGIHSRATLHLEQRDFITYALEFAPSPGPSLFAEETSPPFDLVIANPPYVRTQIMGADVAQKLANQFALTGRVDLYHAFVIGISSVLRPNGAAGVIVSNRFMTTKAGSSVRRIARERFDLRHVWDLGDTKLFGAAVLPAVLFAKGKNGRVASEPPRFSSIYATREEPEHRAPSIIAALEATGIVSIPEGRRFKVQHGTLGTAGGDEDIWKIATDRTDAWLATVARHTWGTFRNIGKVRVGVKTCADKVFIREDWDKEPESTRPELLRTLTTHHIGRRFRANPSLGQRQILYTHECLAGKRRAIKLDDYPRTKAYLERHRDSLAARSYVLDAGRQWFEIWVPQDPDAWKRTKLIFRDISEEPCFWIDREGSVVNGDCYWLVADDKVDENLLWLAASVGNSKFIESFYDHSFNNKLYAGRRRFITQYVEKFPLPDPSLKSSRQIIELAKSLYDTADQPQARGIETRISRLVQEAFGLGVKEVSR